MSTTRTTEPTEITQGERVAWSKSFEDYSAEDYTLAHYFRPVLSGNGFDIAATADGSGFACVITAAMTAPNAVATGKYTWQSWLTQIGAATNTFIVETGELTVKPGFVAGVKKAVDLRTPAKIALDSIDAAMAAFATSDIQEYEITTPAGSRRVKRSARADLLNLQKHYAGLVAREMAAEQSRKTGKFGKSVNVRIFDNG